MTVKIYREIIKIFKMKIKIFKRKLEIYNLKYKTLKISQIILKNLGIMEMMHKFFRNKL